MIYRYKDSHCRYWKIVAQQTHRVPDATDYDDWMWHYEIYRSLNEHNCEIGRRVLSWMPSLFRAICMNGCIHGQEKGANSRFRHKSKKGEVDLKDIRKRMQEDIQAQIPLVSEQVEKILAARSYVWKGDSVKPVIAELHDRLGMQRAEARAALSGYKDEISETTDFEKSAFAFINAVTRGAQSLGDDAYERMNVMGGKMLEWDKSRWDSIFSGARHWKSEKMDKIFAVAG